MAINFCIPRTGRTVQHGGGDRTLVVVKIVAVTSRTVVTEIHAYDVVTLNEQFHFSYLKTMTGEVC
jgi:hypothetical protein